MLRHNELVYGLQALRPKTEPAGLHGGMGIKSFGCIDRHSFYEGHREISAGEMRPVDRPVKKNLKI